jgi:hypothetical protein
MTSPREVENNPLLQPKHLKTQTKNQKQPKTQPTEKKFYADTHNNNQTKIITSYSRCLVHNILLSLLPNIAAGQKMHMVLGATENPKKRELKIYRLSCFFKLRLRLA